jgi:hypothetical protein
MTKLTNPKSNLIQIINVRGMYHQKEGEYTLDVIVKER